MKRWITLDCFGTLVDWRHGIANGIDLVAPGRGRELLDVFERHEPDVQREHPGMRYGDVLTEAMRRTADEAQLGLVQDDLRVLAAGVPFWPVFPDTRRALRGLREAGWNLALLTNCDNTIISETRRRLGVPFDAVVTAEDCGAYKPAHDHFTHFERSLGVPRDRWVHVAQSHFHDMVPARELGLTRVWINRLGLNADPSVAHAVRSDLTGLAGVVEEVWRERHG